MATIPYTYISGTINGFTFYVVNGRQLVRSKTSINQQRFYSDPAFATQRQYSEWLKIASPMASAIYRQLPPQKGLQQRITGTIMRWLKQGVAPSVAYERLKSIYLKNNGEQVSCLLLSNEYNDSVFFNDANTTDELMENSSIYYNNKKQF
ncbi:hypothetical protein [Hydrotalea sp.]|uniref:hypothetical protein n=1 Tax=Hydrotalea sp. TaxID=2881279 RepID=UPI003D0DA960